MIRIISDGFKDLAIIVRGSYKADGIEFITPDAYTQQLGYMNRPKGYVILPHVHNPVKRTVEYTKEVLIIRTGIVRVDFYAEDRTYLESVLLKTGDVVLLAYGGHGFEIIEDADIVEIKQGPYAGGSDKTRFEPVSKKNIIFKDFK